MRGGGMGEDHVTSRLTSTRNRRVASHPTTRRPMSTIWLIFFVLVTSFSLSMIVVVQIIITAQHNKWDKLTALDLSNTEWPEYEEYNATGDTQSQDEIWSSSLDHWHPVRSSKHRFYVFSAYIDCYNRSNLHPYPDVDPSLDNTDYFVRVIAVTQLLNKEKVICSYNTAMSHQRIFREGKMKAIREHWNLKFSAFFIYCPLPKKVIRNSISSDGIHTTFAEYNLSIMSLPLQWSFGRLLQPTAQLDSLVPSNQLGIHPLTVARGAADKSAVRMAVCIKPLHYYYNKGINFIEFIELNRILGAEHFYFYNHTVGRQVDQLLQMYATENVVTTLPWSLPVRSQTEIRTEGIFAAINDCLYRAKVDSFSHVLFIDLDEFIIPQRHSNLAAFIADIQHIYRNKVGGYSFRNGFFYLQYPDDSLETIRTESASEKILARQLVTLSKTLRKPELNLHKQRSKCVVLPEYTVEMGNHFVWEYSAGRHTLNVDPSMAYLHHYRVCEFGGDQCVRRGQLRDRRTHTWASLLIRRVHHTLQSLCVEHNKVDQDQDSPCAHLIN